MSTKPPARSSRRSLFGSRRPALPVRSFGSDEELLAILLRDDDEATWRAFFLRFEGLIVSTLLRAARARGVWLGGDDVDDLRASFVTVLLAEGRRALRVFDPARGITLASWIVILAERHTLTCLRARHVRARCRDIELALLGAGPGAREPTPEELALRKEQVERVRGAVGTLGRRQRELYDLHIEQGLDPIEVARRMGTSLQTVHSCRHKMELRLRSVALGAPEPLPAA